MRERGDVPDGAAAKELFKFEVAPVLYEFDEKEVWFELDLGGGAEFDVARKEDVT